MAFSHTAPRIEFQELEDEIRRLTDKERKDLERDLYGKYDNEISVEPNNKLCIASLVELRKVLNDMDPDETNVYRQALQHCPMYVTSESFLLCFLRAEDFHIENAAKRLVRYWNEKYELFGEDHTFGPMTLKSLQSNDLNVIQNGGFAILPKDEHGRIVIHRDRVATKVKQNGRDSALRAFFYLVHVAIEDDFEAQRKGMVILSASQFAFQLENHDRIYMKRLFYLILSCLPIRTVSYHIVGAFLSANFSTMVMPSLHWLMGTHMSLRHRVHNGTSKHKLQTSLAMYGITKIPTFLGGNVEYNGKSWLEKRRIDEIHFRDPWRKSSCNIRTPKIVYSIENNMASFFPFMQFS